jgi:SAM-dependent methyltransferase
MAPRLLRRLAGAAPAGVRRAVAGALLDLKSLPARLRDPARRAEPWAFVHNVGDGDFVAVGAQLLRNLKDHAGLVSGDRVLDIGCGNGRVAELRWRRFSVQLGGLAKVGSGSDHAASLCSGLALSGASPG